ncbi:MAG: 50S ribosome-binding GTPase [Desulfovibrio sp.]|jgi:sulfate adenylyltransferase large subunit|nr:50S ribosome-binding GTPase [Desulfovibrio sp.]
MGKGADPLKLVVAGHVDHGKSSVIGRLLHDTHSLPQGTVDRVKRIARETGKDFEFAYLLDALEEEQKQGVTIDITRLQFRTQKREYIIIDAPGHKEFLKNMVSGAADAEAAFLVIDAARGVEEQSKRHACMLSLLGIRQICLIVNKMDLIAYDEARFTAIKEGMNAFLASLGLMARDAIPFSALRGDNVLEPSPLMPWHKGHTLIQTLDDLEAARRPDQAALRFPVQDVYKFDERRIIAGRIESGTLRAGDEIVIHPGGKKTRVRSLAFWRTEDEKTEVRAGESVGIIVEDEFFNQRGEVISHAERPPLITRSFRASVFWLGKKPLRRGNRYKLKIATRAVEVVVEEIFGVIDSSTLALDNRAQELSLNDVAEVELGSQEALALDLFADCRALGRFVLVEGYDVAGGGVITADLSEEAAPDGFAHGELKARCEIFEEYHYNVKEKEIKKSRRAPEVYTLGDALPLSGKSYAYPDFFDIVVMRDRIAVSVREGKVTDIIPLEEYRYGGLPVLNGRGFAFLVRSGADWERCREEFTDARPKDEAALSARWLHFGAFRSIPFADGDWEI